MKTFLKLILLNLVIPISVSIPTAYYTLKYHKQIITFLKDIVFFF